MRIVLVLSMALLAAPAAVSATPAGLPAQPQPAQPVQIRLDPAAQLYLEQVKVKQSGDTPATEAAARFPKGSNWWWVAGAIAVKAVILVLVL